MGDLRKYHAVEKLKNGLDVTVRAIRPDDKDRIIDAFRNLDRESVYTRFFGRSGLAVKQSREDGVVHVTLDL